MSDESPRKLSVTDKIVARLQLTEDGSLSNRKVERYALLRAEEVMAPSAAWTVTMSSGRGNLPSGNYQAQVHKSHAFKHRLETLMAERQELEDRGPWGQAEWQVRQIYRRAAALDDVKAQLQATELLVKILARNDRPAKVEESDDSEKRGRGAPSIPVPDPVDDAPDYIAEKLMRAGLETPASSK